MSFLKDIIDKQRLKKCLELLKSHVATSVNGQKPDKNGAVNISLGVESVDGITPDEAGNVKIPVASDEEVAAGETNEKYMTPANTLFAINKRTANYYNSVEAMKADRKLKAGMTACTLGYYFPNDGGAGTYIIRAKADGDIDDGGSLHELASGLVAELVVENGTVNVKQFGAKGDGVTDDTTFFVNSLKYNDCVFVPHGTYRLTHTVFLANGKKLYGDSNNKTVLLRDNTLGDTKNFILLSSNTSFRDFFIDVSGNFEGSVIKVSNKTLTDAVTKNTPIVNVAIDNISVYYSGAPANKHTSIIELSIEDDTSMQGFYGVNVNNVQATCYPAWHAGYFVKIFAKPAGSWINGCVFNDCYIDGIRWGFFFGAEDDEHFRDTNNQGMVSNHLISNTQHQSKKDNTNSFVFLAKQAAIVSVDNCICWDWSSKNNSAFASAPYAFDKSLLLGMENAPIPYRPFGFAVTNLTSNAVFASVDIINENVNVQKINLYQLLTRVLINPASYLVPFMNKILPLENGARKENNNYIFKSCIRLLKSSNSVIFSGSDYWLGLFFKYSCRSLKVDIMINLNSTVPYVVMTAPLPNPAKFYYYTDLEGNKTVYMKILGNPSQGFLETEPFPLDSFSLNTIPGTHNNSITLDTLNYPADEVYTETPPNEAIEITDIRLQSNNYLTDTDGNVWSLTVSNSGTVSAKKI